MEQSRKRTVKRKTIVPPVAPIMSEMELARLGDGQVAYIRMMSSKEARSLFPMVEGLPKRGTLFALHAADGTPIALTDSHVAAVGHAREGELEVASIH